MPDNEQNPQEGDTQGVSPELVSAIVAAVRTELKNDISATVNSAVTAHLKRAKKAAPAPSSEDSETEASTPEAKPGDPLVAKLERKVKELEKANRQATEKAKRAEAANALSGLIKGKVADDWQDVALERLMSGVDLSGDTPQVIRDDIPYTLEEHVSEFLSSPANKRFLPAPKTAQRTPIVPQITPSPARPGQPLTFEDKLGLLGDTEL